MRVVSLSCAAAELLRTIPLFGIWFLTWMRLGRAGVSRNPDKAVTWEVAKAGSFCVGGQSRRGYRGKQPEWETSAVLLGECSWMTAFWNVQMEGVHLPKTQNPFLITQLVRVCRYLQFIWAVAFIQNLKLDITQTITLIWRYVLSTASLETNHLRQKAQI